MYKLLLCERYLKTRFIALASVISVMLGVATMIVVNSVMAGFATQMKDRIHGLLADIIVESHSLDGVDNPDRQMALARHAAGPYIEAMTPTIEIYGMMNFYYAGQWITRPVTLLGIDPKGKSEVGPLKDYLESYQVKTTTTGPAEHGREVVPTWNLTPEAQKYREDKTRLMLDQQAWMQDESQIFNANSNFARLDDDGVSLGVPPAPTKPQTEVAAEGIVQTSMHADGKTAGEINPWETAVSGSELNFEDPFGQTMSSQSKEPVDPAAPMAARVYVGKGLISYPYKDPETGKMETFMMARPGDDVKLSTITAGRPPQPAHFSATIVDIFKSGMSEYDSNLVMCNLEDLQRVRGMLVEQTGQRSISAIQIKLKNYADADVVVKLLQDAFPSHQFSVKTWEQKQGPLLAAVEVESAILNVLLFLIIAVAGFGILAIFYMIVVEKTRDIGILKALGASSSGVMSIFLSYGLGLGIVGSGVGVALGLLFVEYINVIEGWITVLTGRKVFDETIYYFPEIPTVVSPMMVFWVAFGAITIAVLASVLPARRASRLHPVKALRYE
ncbi:ABC transporter permease [Lacunimicrobium album]